MGHPVLAKIHTLVSELSKEKGGLCVFIAKEVAKSLTFILLPGSGDSVKKNIKIIHSRK